MNWTLKYNATESQRMVNDFNTLAKTYSDWNYGYFVIIDKAKSQIHSLAFFPYDKDRLDSKIRHSGGGNWAVYAEDAYLNGVFQYTQYFASRY